MLSQAFSMVAYHYHQSARLDSVKQAAYLLVHVCDFTGVRIARVEVFVRFGWIVRSVWIEIVHPEKELLFPILLEPCQSAIRHHRRATLRRVGRIADIVIVRRKTIRKSECFGENAGAHNGSR